MRLLKHLLISCQKDILLSRNIGFWILSTYLIEVLQAFCSDHNPIHQYSLSDMRLDLQGKFSVRSVDQEMVVKPQSP